MADRAKISELRKNPNISSVEMTGYGTPYEGEKKKGSQTASVKSGKGLAKKDFDGDGKVESPTAEYKGSKDKAIKKALAKEGFQLDESDIADIIARLEKKRISKGGDPDKSPLGKKPGQAMKAKQDAARKKAGVKTEGYKGTMDMSKSHPEAVKKLEKNIEKFAGKKVPGGKMGVKKEEVDPMVQSAVDALNRYSAKKQ